MIEVVILEIIASIGFLAATLCSFFMYKKSFYVTSIWMHITIAMFCMCIASITNVLEWLHIIPASAESLEEIMRCLGAYALFTVTLSYFRESNLHQSMEA